MLDQSKWVSMKILESPEVTKGKADETANLTAEKTEIDN